VYCCLEICRPSFWRGGAKFVVAAKVKAATFLGVAAREDRRL
jgi:hypothetical protein